MARRMYDLDNGTEDIKVKELVVNGTLKVRGGDDSINITIGSMIEGHPDYIKSNHGLDLMVGEVAVASLITSRLALNRVLNFAKYPTIERPSLLESYAGSVIYDSTLGKLILWNGTAWVNLDGTSLGE